MAASGIRRHAQRPPWHKRFPCERVLPHTRACRPLPKTPEIYEGLDAAGRPTGLAFVTGDLVPPVPGYGGPIHVLVGVTPDRRISRVVVLAHHETPSYTRGLPDFLAEFSGKPFDAPMTLGKDIEGMTGATVSSRAVAASIRAAVTKAGSLLGWNPGAPRSEAPKARVPLAPFVAVTVPFLLAAYAARRPRPWRRLALWAGFLCLGIWQADMLSVAYIGGASLLQIPPFTHKPIWFLLLGGAISTTLLFGPIYCGGVCPFAGIQEAVFHLRHRGRIPPDEPRPSAARVRFLVLAVSLAVGILLNASGILAVEPFMTLFTRRGGSFAWLLLLFALATAAWRFRFWCRYLCPVGAALGLLGQKALFRIRLRDADACSLCGECRPACPVQAITPDGQGRPRIDPTQCLVCGACRAACPEGSLVFRRNGGDP